ncbi:MAG: sigma 54-interacting transcriptional regulator [Myxococcales bacterium]|nr:sigma 54-interacting transcriptional regulator [Myxococcales bacterium]MCB9754410.1 sigma 54-interacting transcriptional regulator [Myxococcales bacterium]
MPHLSYRGPDGSIQRYSILRRLTAIGASPECHITLRGGSAAQTHCTLEHEPGRFRLESTSRSNPFFVRGKKYRHYELKHGDIILIGGHELTFSTIDELPKERVTDEDVKRQKIGAMQELRKFSELLLQPGDLDDLLNELIDQVVSLTRANKGFLVLADEEVRYSVRVARNLERQPVDDPEELLSDKIIKQVIEERAPQIISDAFNDTRFQTSMSVINLKLSSVMCVPLIVRGELLGLIYVGNNSIVDLFKESDLELLKVFAGQAALFIKNAQLLNELKSETADLQDRLERNRFGQIIGACPQMLDVYKRVRKVAATDIGVLITGETGTGKELIAHEIHDRSPRASGPFVTVNCGAIPENLIESELFGHLKGSFTGAVSNKIGKFQAAHNGTIFLDEIGELPLGMQVKFLRVLQERKVQRVGESATAEIDIRVVAATNRDLKREVAEGRFREDLYHRLNVIGVHLPPLRERGDDVVLIARYLLGRYADQFGVKLDPARAFDPSAIRALMRFEWPGNIRQLENHIKKALVLAEGPTLSASDLELEVEVPGARSGAAPGAAGEVTRETVIPLSEARDMWQREYINRVLALNNGNRTKTARDLGVDPRTIFRHLEKETR